MSQIEDHPRLHCRYHVVMDFTSLVCCQGMCIAKSFDCLMRNRHHRCSCNWTSCDVAYVEVHIGFAMRLMCDAQRLDHVSAESKHCDVSADSAS